MPSNVLIRPSTHADIPSMVILSNQKRRQYENAHPQFWRYAGEQAEISQAKWFGELLSDEDHIMLIAQNNNAVVGFIIGQIIDSPAVYDPGGLTLMIDDFCVQSESDWKSVGKFLVRDIKALSLTKGVSQVLVVCGAHDANKRNFLRNMGLTVASEWFVGLI